MFIQGKHLCVLINSVVFFLLIGTSDGAIRRCFACRSRGELGSCKDSFVVNATNLIHGVKTQPCASGWCGKIIEGENAFEEEYGLATQRMCLQRGPSDNEERCSQTLWNRKKVFMCFCVGDLCNSGVISTASLIVIAVCGSLLKFV